MIQFYNAENFKKAVLALLFTLCFSPISSSAIVLSDYVADTLSAHPSVYQQVHIFRQIVRDRDIANSGWRPSVDLQASTGLYESESPLLTAPRDYDSNRAELSVTQNIFNGFETTYQLEQVEAQIQSAVLQVYDTADNIALDAVQAYLDVLKQQKLYELASVNVTSHENILAQIRELNDSGVGRRSQLQQTEGRVARAHASLIAQQNNLQDALTQFHEVLGRYTQASQLIEPEMPIRPAISLDELIDLALENHPGLRVANFNITAAQSDYQRSKSNNYPQLDLRLAKEVGSDINGLNGDTDELSLVLNLSYNFYRGGADSATRHKKISVVHEQQQFAARTRRQVINTLRLAWVADQSLSRQLRFLKTHIEKSHETVLSYREEFFIGQRDLVDLLDAESELNAAKNQHTEAYYQALAARYRIYEAVGDLFGVLQLKAHLDGEELQISSLQTQGEDKLPLNDDRDADKELSPSDHCDNTLKDNEVNVFGCKDKPAIQFGYDFVNSNPRLGDDQLSVDQNSVLVIDQRLLLENDTDVDGDELKLVDFTQPETGKLAMDALKNLVYRAQEGFSGLDVFSYTVSDGNGGAATAKVKLHVSKPSEVQLTKTQFINFVYKKTTLTEPSQAQIDGILKKIVETPGARVEVHAYTDNVGSEKYNLKLSTKRANSMRELLISKGLDASKIKAKGMGENYPIADNATPAGRAINRRGEFHFILNSNRSVKEQELLER